MRHLLKNPYFRSALHTLAFFVLLRLGGAHHRLGVLSGTLDGGRTGLFFGLLYALTYFAVALLVPPLVLTALVGQPGRGVGRSR